MTPWTMSTSKMTKPFTTLDNREEILFEDESHDESVDDSIWPDEDIYYANSINDNVMTSIFDTDKSEVDCNVLHIYVLE